MPCITIIASPNHGVYWLVLSLLRKLYDYTSASEVTLENMDKYIIWIQYDITKPNQTKPNQSPGLILGLYSANERRLNKVTLSLIGSALT